MSPEEIKTFLENHNGKREKTIVLVDFSNVEKWKESLGWKVGIHNLATFIKRLSGGNRELQRFYYGSDYGPSSKSVTLTPWSERMLTSADANRFKVITKPVKYIPTGGGASRKKCDFDVEMALDLIKFRELYDHVVLFSGDGDLVPALEYVRQEYEKQEMYVFTARDHVGKEVIDGEGTIINKVFFAGDFESRLGLGYGRGGGPHAIRSRR